MGCWRAAEQRDEELGDMVRKGVGRGKDGYMGNHGKEDRGG